MRFRLEANASPPAGNSPARRRGARLRRGGVVGLALACGPGVATTSNADGTPHCFDGGGHVTDTYVLEGSLREVHNPDPPPFGECDYFDGRLGPAPDLLIARRADV